MTRLVRQQLIDTIQQAAVQLNALDDDVRATLENMIDLNRKIAGEILEETGKLPEIPKLEPIRMTVRTLNPEIWRNL